MTTHLLLASQSPRRRELIKLVGLPFSAISANVNESTITEPDPANNAVKTAELKAKTIFAKIPPPSHRTIIVAADTIVALNKQMLGKPKNDNDAWHMLHVLRNRQHDVHTGMVLIDTRSGKMIEGVHTAVVTMRPYTDTEINTYIGTGDPRDKAGAYAIQHPQFKPVNHLDGCYLAVVGLSICHLLQMLTQLDVLTSPDLSTLDKAHQATHCPLYHLFAKN